MLDWIKTFVAVYRARSVTGAARALHLSQPTVSQHLKGLEAHVGAPLFDRTARGVSPTPAGHELAQAVRSHLDMLEIALASSRHKRAANALRTVRLGGPAELLSERVVPALAPLLEEGVHLRVTLGLPEEMVAAVRARELDVAVATARVRGRGIAYDELYREELVLVAGRTWSERLPAAVLRRRGPDALADVPLLAYAGHRPLLSRYWRAVFGVRLRATPRLVAPDLRLLLRATAAGAGITVLPGYLVQDALARGELFRLATFREAPHNTIHLAYLRRARGDDAVATVRALLLRVSPSW